MVQLLSAFWKVNQINSEFTEHLIYFSQRSRAEEDKKRTQLSQLIAPDSFLCQVHKNVRNVNTKMYMFALFYIKLTVKRDSEIIAMYHIIMHCRQSLLEFLLLVPGVGLTLRHFKTDIKCVYVFNVLAKKSFIHFVLL